MYKKFMYEIDFFYLGETLSFMKIYSSIRFYSVWSLLGNNILKSLQFLVFQNPIAYDLEFGFKKLYYTYC